MICDLKREKKNMMWIRYVIYQVKHPALFPILHSTAQAQRLKCMTIHGDDGNSSLGKAEAKTKTRNKHYVMLPVCQAAQSTTQHPTLATIVHSTAQQHNTALRANVNLSTLVEFQRRLYSTMGQHNRVQKNCGMYIRTTARGNKRGGRGTCSM